MAVGDLLSLTVRGSTQFDQDGSGFGVDGNGWVADLIIEGLPAIADPTAVNANKIVLTVSDSGFDQTGAVVTRTRTIRGGKVLRKQATNDAQLWVGDDGNGNTLIRFSLEDDVYQATTITGATVASGLYPGNTTGSPASIVNGSTWAYRKALVGWANRQFERATGSAFLVELFAYHWEARFGQQVACVKLQGRDAQATPNLTPEVVVGAPTLSTIQTQGQIAECFKASLALANLTQGDACKVHFKVYPWIGDASAILDSLVDGIAWPTTSPRTPLNFCCDKNGTYGGAFAYVKAGATGGTASRTAATARAAPFPTIQAAIAALPALNNTTATPAHNDTGGGIVRLMDDGAGGGVAHQLGAITAAAGKCWCRIELDPANTAAAGTVKVQTTGINAVADLLEWAVPIEQIGFTCFDGGNTKRVSFEAGCTLKQTQSGLCINYQCAYGFFRNCAFINGGQRQSCLFNYSTETTGVNLALGVVAPAGMTGVSAAHCTIGCYLPGFVIGSRPPGQGLTTQDLDVNANNVFLNIFGTEIVAGQWDIDNGYALVQTLIEAPNNQLQPALQISADGIFKRLRNVLVFHNTVVGERVNFFYADANGDQGVLKRGRAIFNLFANWNAKTDTFRTDYYPAAPDTTTGRVSNWSFRYGVGALGNVVLTGDRSIGHPDARAFLADYFPGGAYNVGQAAVTFVNNQAPDGGASAGMGDYRLTGTSNAAYAQVPSGRAVLNYDLQGRARLNDGNGAAGAYERDPLPISGTENGVEGNDALIGAGGLLVSGTVALAEAADTLTGGSGFSVAATFAASEAADTLAGVSSIVMGGAFAGAEGADVLASSAELAFGQISGQTAASEGPDTLAGASSVNVIGQVVQAEQSDAIAATATAIIGAIVNVAELPDTTTTSASLPIGGLAAGQEADDRIAAIGSLQANANLNLVEGDDVPQLRGVLPLGGAFAPAEQPDGLAAAATLDVRALIVLAEDADILTTAGGVETRAITAATEGPDSLAAIASAPVAALFVGTEAYDMLISEGGLAPIGGFSASAALTEADDGLTANVLGIRPSRIARLAKTARRGIAVFSDRF